MNIFALLFVCSTHSLPTIHVIAPFYTEVSDQYSTCAFTTKVLRFSTMMQFYGWRVVEYSNGVSQSTANTKVPILSVDELQSLRRVKNRTGFIFEDAVIGSPLHRVFTIKLHSVIGEYVKDGDIVCHISGQSYMGVVEMFPKALHVECGVGYEHSWAPYRIFDTYAWMHYTLGQQKIEDGNNYFFVVPMAYALHEWPVKLRPTAERYVAFFGRMVLRKGMNTLIDIIRLLPNRTFRIAGPGNFSDWFSEFSNVHYAGSLVGSERAEFLGNAASVLMPTSYIEPFGSGGVEAQLCGTPLIGSNFGGFVETIEHGVTGFRCNTLADWIAAINAAENLDRSKIALLARKKYNMHTVGAKFDAALRTIADLSDKGWYSNVSHNIPSIGGSEASSTRWNHIQDEL
jgi:glycosyltransferase involved in cell wall biosynthesis